MFKRWFVIILLLLTLVSVISCKHEKKEGQITVGILQLIDSPILDTARNGIIEGLAEKGYTEGKNLIIDYKNAQGEMGNIPMLLKSFSSDKVDILITITTPCMVAAAKSVRDFPVVFSIAFSPAQMGITPTPDNMTGVSDPMDMTEFVELIKKIKPGIKRFGVPYNNSEANSVFAVGRLEEVCKRNDIELVKLTINNTNDIPQAAEALALKKVEVFTVSADNTLNAGIQSLMKTAEKYKIPVFSTATDYVKSGVCAGIGADYKKWGKSSAYLAADILKGAKPDRLPVKDVDSYTVEINLKAAKAQGVTIPEDIVKTAAKVYD
jgi:putative ABC transport system substrate-binding protein